MAVTILQSSIVSVPARQVVTAQRRATVGQRATLISKRNVRTIVRAQTEEKSVVDQAEDAFKQQVNQVDKTVKEPLAQGKPATDANNTWDNSIKEAGKAETEKLGTQISIPDALRFRGVGPEHINSRLAMIGVTTGYLTKLITGENTLDQYAAAPLPVILTFIVFIAASLIPITKGVTPEKAQNGIWTTKAEIYNGRLAMIGFISLLATDGWQWFSALQAAKGASL